MSERKGRIHSEDSDERPDEEPVSVVAEPEREPVAVEEPVAVAAPVVRPPVPAPRLRRSTTTFTEKFITLQEFASKHRHDFAAPVLGAFIHRSEAANHLTGKETDWLAELRVLAATTAVPRSQTVPGTTTRPEWFSHTDFNDRPTG